MSINNQYFIQEIGKKWYGWDIMAEGWGDDPFVTVYKSEAITAPSLKKLIEKMRREQMLFCEYGISNDAFLMKDGTPIVIAE